MGLPLDNCFYNNTCGGNVGDGQWDCNTYWHAVHPAGHAWDTTKGQCGSGTALSPTTVSRYTVYQYEISQGWLNDTPTAPGSRETGAPQCNAGAVPADRRLIYVGIVNCGSTGVTIQSNGTVPVAGFGKFFITQPFASGNPTTTAYLYGEFTDLVVPRQDPNVHQSVQLYR